MILVSYSHLFGRGLYDPVDSSLFRESIYSKSAIATPLYQTCVHKANNMLFSVTNFGCFGSMIGYYRDCETNKSAPSCEFPAGTNQNYLWIGGLWIGAVVGMDTLTSVSYDGWHNNFEMWPCSSPDCGLVKMSNRPTDPNYDDSAKSDLDFIAVYTDTLTDGQWIGMDWEERAHVPLNLKITQRSYSWSADYAQDFVLIDYNIENIGSFDLEDAYLGIYVDAEAGHLSRYAYCHLDDLCGYRQTYPSNVGNGYMDTINLAYIADDNGDPNDNDGVYDHASVQSATGIRIMRKPDENLHVSFNWWISSSSSSFDWGPMLAASRRNYGTGGKGTPEGDANKYYLMANGEHDYDQIFAAKSNMDEGWLPPSPTVGNQIARGGDTRFVFSMGPFELPSGNSIPFTIAYVAGEKFHRSPEYFDRYMMEKSTPPRLHFLLYL